MENSLEERRSEVNWKTIFIVQKLKEKKGQIQGMFKRESTRHSDLLEVWQNKGMRWTFQLGDKIETSKERMGVRWEMMSSVLDIKSLNCL